MMSRRPSRGSRFGVLSRPAIHWPSAVVAASRTIWVSLRPRHLSPAAGPRAARTEATCASVWLSAASACFSSSLSRSASAMPLAVSILKRTPRCADASSITAWRNSGAAWPRSFTVRANAAIAGASVRARLSFWRSLRISPKLASCATSSATPSSTAICPTRLFGNRRFISAAPRPPAYSRRPTPS